MQSENLKATNDRSYIAFISYRHLPLDRETAIRIQKRIESYTVPKDYRDKTGGKKLGTCFRDEDELPASSSLSDSITYALDRSQFLIVICTPDLPESKWCLAEIRYFLKTHDRSHVLAVLADGTPEESFPDELLFVRGEDDSILDEVEPLAANIAGPDHKLNQKVFKKETTRLCAAMLGCPFDALWQRERRARTNRLLGLAGAAVAVMAVFLGVVMNRNARIEEQNVQIQAQVDQITEQNEEISRQNRELEKEMSSALVDNGILDLQQFNRTSAVQNALDALSSNDPEIYDHRAEKLLADALMAYSPGTPECMQLMRQTTDIERISASKDGKTAFTADRVGNIHALNTETGEILWSAFLGTKKAPYLYPVENDLLLCKTPETLTAFSMKDGSVLWTYDYDLPNNFQAISDDGTRFAVLDWNKSYEDILAQVQGAALPDHPVDMYLKILDTETGADHTLFSIPADPYAISVNAEDPIYRYAGDFSDDNNCVAAALPSIQDGQSGTLLFFADYRQGRHEIACIEGYQAEPDMLPGAEISADAGSVFWTIVEANNLLSVISFTDPDTESAVSSTNFVMSSPDGLPTDYILNERPYLPMMTSENLIVLFSRNNIYIMDRSDGSLRYILSLESPVLDAVWLDRAQESLEVLTQNGRIVSYLLTYDKEYMVHDFYAVTIPASDLTAAYRVYNNSAAGDIYSDYVLAVSATQPGYLFGIIQSHDLDYQPSGALHDTNCSFALPAPSGDRMMLFYPVAGDQTKAHVETIDIKNGTILEAADIDIASGMTFPVSGKNDGPVVTDDSHFILYGHLYGLDGSVTDINTEFDDDLQNMTAVNKRGQTIYACFCEGSGTYIPYLTPYLKHKTGAAVYWWINGEKQEMSGDITGSIAMEYEERDDPAAHFAIGKNSWIAGWGYYVSAEETSAATEYTPAITRPVVAEQFSVAAINAVTGEKVEVQDNMMGTPVSHLVLSNRDPYMACAYENGVVMVYNLRKLTSYQINTAYAKGEIQEICFSDDDSYLLILNVSGRVDVFPINEKKAAVSLSQCFTVPQNDMIDRFYAAEDSENGRLILTAANESGRTDLDSYKAKYWTTVLDTKSWETLAAPEDVCFWSVRNGQTVIVNGTALGTCRIHTLSDLIAWAKEGLRN